KLPHGVAQTASRHGVPCVVLAGRVAVAEEEAAAAGVTAAHSLVESAGSVQAALEHSARELRRLAARVAADWPR
ncbi:MAG UNVERIFIED_CONTAM: glycerate kinase, partial [Thermobifida fusca]